MKELIYTCATRLSELIQTREVSSEEVVRAYIERIAEVNPHLKAVIQLRAEAALSEAQ
jgi:Asp-tRNA(Asn)/Glu-tRNA(Gln) amidotransferase A subunit family amidase